MSSLSDLSEEENEREGWVHSSGSEWVGGLDLDGDDRRAASSEDLRMLVRETEDEVMTLQDRLEV